MNQSKEKYIYISAGEASGDLYGGHLIKELKKINDSIKIKAMGGKLMKEMGAVITQSIDELQLIGTLEITSKIWSAFKILRKIKNILKENPPSLAILIDYPDFHFRLAKFLKKINVPVIYFVSPQIWAWRTYRINILKKIIDLMIPLFKFEDALYKQYNVPSIFFGHPLLDIIKIKKTKGEFLASYNLSDKDFIIGIMPGSRKMEIKNHMNTLLNICQKCIQKAHSINKKIFFYLIKASTLPDNLFSPYRQKRDKLNISFIEQDKYEAMKYADFLLVASGTATLEACILETPMLVFYKVNWLSWILGRWLIKVPFLCIVNIIANQLIVPEYYQGAFNPNAICEALFQFIEKPALLNNQRLCLKKVKDELGEKNATKAIANYILKNYWHY